MGKHDKQEEQKVEFRWDPPKDGFYKARISRLENENKTLRDANAKMSQLDRYADTFGKQLNDKVKENYDLEEKLFELQSKYDSALKYIEELEQAKFDLENKVDEYESAILKVVVQI